MLALGMYIEQEFCNGKINYLENDMENAYIYSNELTRDCQPGRTQARRNRRRGYLFRHEHLLC